VSGAIIQFGIKRVVIGEDKNFKGNIDFLRNHGIYVRLLDDKACKHLMHAFIAEKPDLWDKDISGNASANVIVPPVNTVFQK
jgi:creatinine deaminase